MTDVRINPGASGAYESRFTPGAQTRDRAEAAPQQPAADRVTIQKAEGNGVSYSHERDTAQGVDYQTWSARSGVKYEVASKGDEQRFHVELPGPAPIEISGAAGPNQKAQLIAHPAGDPSQQLPVMTTDDGKYMITLSPTGAMAMFDPQTMDFGVASPSTPQAGPNGQQGTYTALQEVIHADNSHTITANAMVSDGVKSPSPWGMGMPGANMGTHVRNVSYTQIDESASGQVSAKQVVEQYSAAPGGAQPTRQETKLEATRLANGSFQVGGGGSLMSYMKASLANPFQLQSPLLSWMKSKKQGQMNIPSFSSSPGLLASMSAAVGPAAAAAMQMPFAGAASSVPPPPRFSA